MLIRQRITLAANREVLPTDSPTSRHGHSNGTAISGLASWQELAGNSAWPFFLFRNSLKYNILFYYWFIVDVSASIEAFSGTVTVSNCRSPVSVSGQTGCRRCRRVGKTPRLCSSTCLAPSWYNRKKLQFITLLTAICIVSHIENSKNDKGYIT